MMPEILSPHSPSRKVLEVTTVAAGSALPWWSQPDFVGCEDSWPEIGQSMKEEGPQRKMNQVMQALANRTLPITQLLPFPLSRGQTGQAYHAEFSSCGSPTLVLPSLQL